MTAPAKRPTGRRGAPRWRRKMGLLRRARRRLKRRLQPVLADILAKIQRGEHTFMVLVALLVGVLGAYGAIAFRFLIDFGRTAFLSDASSIALVTALPWWQRLLAPALGGLLAGVVITRFSSESRGSGIPEVMEAVARRAGQIRPRVIIAKALAVAFTIGSGGSAGREGPIVHIGSAIGSAAGQWLQVSARRTRTFVACGAAAGIAATFNAPIAGTLFAVEVVLRDLTVSSLSPIVISSVIAVVLSRYHLGDSPAFVVPEYELVDARELVFYVLLGLAAAAVAVVYIRAFHGFQSRFQHLCERLSVADWTRPGIGGLAVGFIALGMPQIYGVGYETIDAALHDRIVWQLLLPLLAVKLLATSLTLGTGGSGGVFAPSLFAGAMLGAGLGHAVHNLFPAWTAGPGAYALVGMGAFVAGVTHAPITAILIIFEMTNDHRIIPPLMLSCVLAVLLAKRWHPESIYTEALVRRSVHLDDQADPNLLRNVPIHSIMSGDPPRVPAQLPLPQVLAHLLDSPHAELFVVDRTGKLLGVLGLAEIKPILGEVDAIGGLVVAADVMLEDTPFVTPNDSLDLVMHLLGRRERHAVPVCGDSKSRMLVGMVSREQVIERYNQRVFEADLTGGFSSIVEAGWSGRSVEVLVGIHLAEVEVPYALVGMTLKEAALRRRYDVEVVLIRTGEAADALEGRPGKVPRPDVVLEAGDHLLVMGTPAAIAALSG